MSVKLVQFPYTTCTSVPTKLAVKPFSKPMKPASEGGLVLPKREPTVIKPRYDPQAPGALVLPRPGESHQVRGLHPDYSCPWLFLLTHTENY